MRKMVEVAGELGTLTHVPYRLSPSPHFGIASTQTVRPGIQAVSVSFPPSVGAGVTIIGISIMEDIGVMEHEGIMKVGVAVMPDAHSTQVLSSYQYWEIWRRG